MKDNHKDSFLNDHNSKSHVDARGICHLNSDTHLFELPDKTGARVPDYMIVYSWHAGSDRCFRLTVWVRRTEKTSTFSNTTDFAHWARGTGMEEETIVSVLKEAGRSWQDTRV